MGVLADEVRKLREERRWIPCSERLPDIGEVVWAFDQVRGSNPALRDEFGWMITYDDVEIQPAHWMPLPEGPG